MNTEANENPQNEEVAAQDGEAPVPAGFKAAREIYEWVEIFVITISLILFVFTFFVRIAYVDGDSMKNTLYNGETLAVSNLFYTPKQGDIVVFQAPDTIISEGGIIKRVIATEGQTVDIDFETWTVYVDGVALDEPYVNFISGRYMNTGRMEFPLTVPEGHIFVMGDNRNNSTDSRDIGCVDTRFVFGRVLFRITPFDRFGTID